MSRDQRYQELHKRIGALLDGEEDWVSAMATVVCELHHAFERFHWTGFYRVTEPGVLRVGPYQGGHGCLEIPFDRGVCGAAARDATLIRLDDVAQFEEHIACSSTTRSRRSAPCIQRTLRSGGDAVPEEELLEYREHLALDGERLTERPEIDAK